MAAVHRNAPHNTLTVSTNILNCSQKLSIALGIIFFIGSLIAAGVFYPRFGTMAFAIAGSGMAAASILFLLSNCCYPKVTSTSLVHHRQKVLPFSLENFKQDAQYRRLALITHTCWSQDSKHNQEILNLLSDDDYILIDFDRIEQHVIRDVCNALKNWPQNRAAVFLERRISKAVITVLNEPEIAAYYGQDMCSLYPGGVYAKLKDDPQLQTKMLKSVLMHFDKIPNPIKPDVYAFANMLLEACQEPSMKKQFLELFEEVQLDVSKLDTSI